MPNQTKRRIAVSRRALVQRINRALREKKQTLRWYGARRSGEGFYVVIDLNRGALSNAFTSRVDVEALGRELGVLRPWEEAGP